MALNKGLVRDPVFRDWLRGVSEPRDMLRELIG
jgi:hypothetical protein